MLGTWKTTQRLVFFSLSYLKIKNEQHFESFCSILPPKYKVKFDADMLFFQVCHFLCAKIANVI